MENLRKRGSRYEDQAAAYLLSENFTIIERNYFTKHGEIDIVAEENGCVCFVEVKGRKTEESGHPLESITASKKAHLKNAARYYLFQKYGHTDAYCRFDVISILGTQLIHIRDAF